MKNTPFKTLLLSVIALTLGAMVADGFLYAEIRAADLSTVSLGAQKDLAKTQNERISAMSASLAKTAADRAKIDSYLVDKDKVIGFLEEVEKTGTALGAPAKIDSVAEDSFALGSTAVPVFRVAASAAGTWKQVALLAEQIRSLPHKIAFTSLSFQKTGDAALDRKGRPAAGAEAQWRVSMEFVAAKSK